MTTSNYPLENLFHSQVWQERASALRLDSPAYYITNVRGLKAAYLRSGLFSDFEVWPKSVTASQDCDWVVIKKLLLEQATDDTSKLSDSFSLLKKPIILPYSSSPYLDLTKPIAPQKNKIAHVHRCERKLTREVGKPELREFKTQDERAVWFEWYTDFQRSQGRLAETQHNILKTWVLSGEKPEWMKLLNLMVGDTPLACGLFYFYNGVFYYYSSAMNPDPKWRKYGPGKLMVDKLIQYATTNGGHTFDFLQGDHSYKSHWNPENRLLYQWIRPVTIKGTVALQALRLKHALRRFSSPKTQNLNLEEIQ